MVVTYEAMHAHRHRRPERSLYRDWWCVILPALRGRDRVRFGLWAGVGIGGLSARP